MRSMSLVASGVMNNTEIFVLGGEWTTLISMISMSLRGGGGGGAMGSISLVSVAINNLEIGTLDDELGRWWCNVMNKHETYVLGGG